MGGSSAKDEPRSATRWNPRRLQSVGFGLLLALPLLQMCVPAVPERPLAGAEQRTKPVRPSLKSWWNGSMANAVEAWTSRRIGFRPSLVRVANQFRLAFGSSPSSLENERIRVCRENWLVQEGYVRSYAEPSKCLDDRAIAEFVADLKELQDRLRASGTAMVFVISPSKAEAYPEFLPAWARERRKSFEGESDLNRLRRHLFSSGVVVFDAPRYLQQRKASAPERFYTKTGIHWNYQTAFQVWRELLLLVNREYGKDLPIPEQIAVDYDSPRGTDCDIAKLLNVYYLPGVEDAIPYPVVRTNALPKADRPDVLFAGTSFSRTLVNSMYLSGSGRRCDYLFYTSKHFTRNDPPEPVEAGTQVDMEKEYIDGFANLDWNSTLTGKEIVILEMLEIRVDELLLGFHKEALAALRSRAAADRLAVRPGE